MKAALRTLFGLLCAVWLFYPVMEARATPAIDIEFRKDGVSGQEWIHARAEFHSHGQETWDTLNAISAYPALHPWIQATKRVRHSAHNGQEFLIEFSFPWPVGRRRSRIAVDRESDTTLSWHQVEGNLQINEGFLFLLSRGKQTYIEYQATIDVGLPDALTRHYRKRFVTEFLDAVYDQALATGSTHTGLTLANSSLSTEH